VAPYHVGIADLAVVANGSGGYMLEGTDVVGGSTGGTREFWGHLQNMKSNTEYQISIKMKHSGTNKLIQMNLFEDDGAGHLISAATQVNQIIDAALTTYTFTMTTKQLIYGNELIFSITAFLYESGSEKFDIDEFSVKQNAVSFINSDTTFLLDELAAVGYSLTYNLVRGWDHAFVMSGKTFCLNPFVSERNSNKIYKSIINGTIDMYDAIPSQDILDAEKFDGEISIGIWSLPNYNLFLLKDVGYYVLNPETGDQIENTFGPGTLSRASVVRFKEFILWLSGDGNDVYMLDSSGGGSAIPITDEDIRDSIQAITDPSAVFAVRDRYNCYRLNIGDSVSKLEYHFSAKKGWHEEIRYLFPEMYKLGLKAIIWFMNSGDIYSYPYTEDELIGYADVYGDYRSGW